MWDNTLPSTLRVIDVRHLALALLSLLIASCAMFSDDDGKSEDWQAQRFYEEGKAALKTGDYQTAIKHFEDLESRFPFGPYAQQAQLELAYAYYKYEEPESAIAAADRFIKLYPRHEAVDYAYYLKGLARFPKPGALDKWFNIDGAERDPGSSEQAFQFLSELVERFPQSKYAPDSLQRMVFLRNYLARYELATARYYFKRGAYIAAANRAKHLLERYPQAEAVPSALEIMANAYDRLNMKDLAADARRVLDLNRSDYGAEQIPEDGG